MCWLKLFFILRVYLSVIIIDVCVMNKLVIFYIIYMIYFCYDVDCIYNDLINVFVYY